jgi:hypothetical protein
MGEQPLAIRPQRQATVMAFEQLGTEQFLEPLELLADRRLRQVEQRRGGGHAARLDHRHEGAQQRGVDVAVHGSSILCLRQSYARHKQHSIYLCKRKT